MDTQIIPIHINFVVQRKPILRRRLKRQSKSKPIKHKITIEITEKVDMVLKLEVPMN